MGEDEGEGGAGCARAITYNGSCASVTLMSSLIIRNDVYNKMLSHVKAPTLSIQYTRLSAMWCVLRATKAAMETIEHTLKMN